MAEKKPTICLWQDGFKWFWDDAEDHGGFDRCIPSGPFDTRTAAIDDALDVFGAESLRINWGMPEHYRAAQATN